jgi:hypothetical protein
MLWLHASAFPIAAVQTAEHNERRLAGATKVAPPIRSNVQ